MKKTILFLLFFLSVLQAEKSTLGIHIAEAARQQIGVTTEYDPAYVSLKYPNGDVPKHTGVCSDVAIRALRGIGLDLQKEIHLDMKRHFNKYPQKWGLRKADKNIDHRRVPNIQCYFERHQIALKKGLNDAKSYRPGDLVVWSVGGGRVHIGVVGNRRITKDRHYIIHNIGRGAQEEDLLFRFEIIGHYRVKYPTETAGAQA